MKKSVGKTAKAIIAAVIVIAIIGTVFTYRLYSREFSSSFTAMDTYITLKAKGVGCKDTLDEVENFVKDYSDNVLSRHIETSEVSKINANGGGTFSSGISDYFDLLLEISRESDGAFDFTLGALSDLWGIGTENAKIPTDKEIKSVLFCSGVDKIFYKNGKISIPEGMSIDFGAAGKGMALDEIKTKYLEKSKISRAVFSLGGSILLYSTKENDTFTVGIRNPDESNDYMAVLTVNEGCVSTSGSYERYFEEDGVRYHHIFDPKTGYPAQSGLVSVTIYSESGTVSDALSTACFVLGAEKGAALAKKYNCEAVFIDTEGFVTVTDGLKDKIEITNDNYTLR